MAKRSHSDPEHQQVIKRACVSKEQNEQDADAVMKARARARVSKKQEEIKAKMHMLDRKIKESASPEDIIEREMLERRLRELEYNRERQRQHRERLRKQTSQDSESGARRYQGESTSSAEFQSVSCQDELEHVEENIENLEAFQIPSIRVIAMLVDLVCHADQALLSNFISQHQKLLSQNQDSLRKLLLLRGIGTHLRSVLPEQKLRQWFSLKILETLQTETEDQGTRHILSTSSSSQRFDLL